MRLIVLTATLTLFATTAHSQDWKTQRYDGSAKAGTVTRESSGSSAYDPSKTATPAYNPEAAKAQQYNPKNLYNPETFQSEEDKKKEKEAKEKKKKRRKSLEQKPAGQ